MTAVSGSVKLCRERDALLYIYENTFWVSAQLPQFVIFGHAVAYWQGYGGSSLNDVCLFTLSFSEAATLVLVVLNFSLCAVVLSERQTIAALNPVS